MCKEMLLRPLVKRIIKEQGCHRLSCLVGLLMLAARHGDKIFGPVVVSNPIDVMNLHLWRQLDSACLFIDQAVLKDVAIPNSGGDISLPIDSAATSPQMVVRPCSLPTVAWQIAKGIASILIALWVRSLDYLSSFTTATLTRAARNRPPCWRAYPFQYLCLPQFFNPEMRSQPQVVRLNIFRLAVAMSRLGGNPLAAPTLANQYRVRIMSLRSRLSHLSSKAFRFAVMTAKVLRRIAIVHPGRGYFIVATTLTDKSHPNISFHHSLIIHQAGG